MKKTMYKVSWHYVNGELTHCTVSPITVIREGILPGCSSPSITAVDSAGVTFLGYSKNYYTTEKDAWDAVIEDVTSSIKSKEDKIQSLEMSISTLKTYLSEVSAK